MPASGCGRPPTMARLVEAQVIADGVYPGAEAVFAEAFAIDPSGASHQTLDFDPDQPRDPDGRWTFGKGSSESAPITLAAASEEDREEEPELRATGGAVPEVQSEELPLFKPAPGMTPHGPLSTVLMPIPPRTSSAQTSSPTTTVSPAGQGRPIAIPAAEIAATNKSGQEQTSASPEQDRHPILKLFSSLFDGTPAEISELKDQLPATVSKHIIPGIIGPGPYARTAHES